MFWNESDILHLLQRARAGMKNFNLSLCESDRPVVLARPRVVIAFVDETESFDAGSYNSIGTRSNGAGPFFNYDDDSAPGLRSAGTVRAPGYVGTRRVYRCSSRRPGECGGSFERGYARSFDNPHIRG